jgi:hypothetical protein
VDAVIELGPQHKGDPPFTARMRRHQSWYRATVLRLPFGTGPMPGSKSSFGNMLRSEDGAAGRNFLTPEIAKVADDRARSGGGTVEVFRLYNNMLSSQPMCFNLFGPLVSDHSRACGLVAAIVPDGVSEVTAVALEYAPEPADQYLGDRTAFDAFVEYRNGSGRLCALGVETKLTEPFSQKEYDGPLYRRWMQLPDAPWRPEAAVTVQAKAHNQLWRDHLLAVAMRHHQDSKYAKTRLMVVRHPGDMECADVVAGYRELLRDGDDSLIDMPLDALVRSWTDVIGAVSHRDWLREFSVRYLELERSSGPASAQVEQQARPYAD